MVEIAVLAVRRTQRVGRFVVGSVPRKGKIDILRDVAAQHGTEVVAHVLRIVTLSARDGTRFRINSSVIHTIHTRRIGIGDACHDVEVRAEESDREPVAEVCPQAQVTIEVHRRRIEVRRIGLTIDRKRGILHRVRTDIVRRALQGEHPHERTALLDIRIDVMEVDPMAVRGVECRIAVRDVLRIRQIIDSLQTGYVGVARRRVDEKTQRVLAVDHQLTHHEIGEVVIRMTDLFRFTLRHLTVKYRMLVVDISYECVAILRITESRTDALRGIVAFVGI